MMWFMFFLQKIQINSLHILFIMTTIATMYGDTYHNVWLQYMITLTTREIQPMV